MDTKVPETPAKEVSEEAPIIDNPRAALENAIITENETIPDPVIDAPNPEEKLEAAPEKEEKPELSEVDRIKEAVQKRINKVVAEKKTAEEQLAEAQAEIARLRANPNAPQDKKDETPTIEQVEAYIIKMREEGNIKEEIAAQRYLIKLEKESAIKEVEERQKKVQSEAQERQQRENQGLAELAKDYISYDEKGQPDMKSDLTLANQKGKLFQTAMSLYNDPELHRAYYNDPDRALGFRRAVQDANRELHAQGLIKSPKVEGVMPQRTARVALADPGAEVAEETQAPSQHLSDADKVREEFKLRARLRNSRMPAK